MISNMSIFFKVKEIQLNEQKECNRSTQEVYQGTPKRKNATELTSKDISQFSTMRSLTNNP